MRDEINGWLGAELGLSAKAALGQRRGLAPERFKGTQLRTVQRAVKALARPLGARDHPGWHSDLHQHRATTTTPTIA